jgi:hypothetical protein
MATDTQTAARQELENRVRTRALTDSPTFCEAYRPRVTHPVRGQVVFAPFDFQADFMRALDVGGPCAVLKARQIGISTTLMLQKLARCQLPGRTVLVVSRKEATAKELLRIARHGYETCDPPFPAKLVTDNALELGFDNGSRMIAESASESAGRTVAASDVVFDEFAYLPWQQEMWQSVRPTVSRSGNVAVVSSPSLEGDLFHTVCLQAQEASSGWRYFELPWRVCPDYDDEWHAKERPNYTAAQWGEEYECRFGSTSDAVFRAEYVTAAIERGKALQPGRAGVALGADVAGEGRDQTVLVYLTEHEGLYCPEVYGAYDVLSAPDLQSRLEAAVTQLKVPLWLDQTGLGWGIKGNLQCPVTGVVFTGGQAISHPSWDTWHIPRAKLINNAVLAFEQGIVAIPPGQEQLLLGLRAYRWDKKLGVNADFVDALLLALWAATQKQPEIVFEVW